MEDFKRIKEESSVLNEITLIITKTHLHHINYSLATLIIVPQGAHLRENLTEPVQVSSVSNVS